MKRVNRLQRRPVSLLEGLECRKLFAVNYTIVDLAPDTGGITHVGEAYGISDNGKIAGQYDGNAAWWSADGTVHDLGFDGWATDINDNGVVCGVDRTGGISQPFVWKDGDKTILSLDGNTNGVATAINDAGTVVGSFFQTGIARKSFRAPLGGSAINIGAPAGFEFVDATGINDNGQIIGEVYSFDQGYKAFIKSGSTFKLLGPLPGGSTTHAGHGIKNNGDIAIWGPSADLYNGGPTKVYHAYVVTSNGYGPILDKGTYNNSFYDIDASDINSSNVITGNNNPGLNDEQGMINRGSGFDLVQNQISAAAGWSRIFSANQVNDSGRVVGEGLNALGQRSPYVLIPIETGKSISGTLWNDGDADGFKDAGESNSGVRTVFIDANGNGKLDGGEKSTSSNSSGQYTFTGLANGTYKISRVFPSGYGLSNGTGGAPYVTVNVSGANVTNVNLGSRTVSAAKGSISGVLWNDSDADGIFDGSESASGVRQVFIDTNGNKKLDAGEISTYSDSAGKYKFSNLNAGTYKVTRVFPSGYKLSNNSAGFVTVSLTTGQNKTGVNLGSRTA